MKVENRHVHVVLWLKNLIATIIYVLLVFAIYLTDFFDKLISGVGKNEYTIFFGLIYIIILIYPDILRYSYISFSDAEGKIILNFYSFGFFGGKKQSIRMPVREFYDFEVKKSLFGLRKSIILYKKAGNRVAKFPPVYLTALSGEQQTRIINTLSRYKRAH